MKNHVTPLFSTFHFVVLLLRAQLYFKKASILQAITFIQNNDPLSNHNSVTKQLSLFEPFATRMFHYSNTSPYCSQVQGYNPLRQNRHRIPTFLLISYIHQFFIAQNITGISGQVPGASQATFRQLCKLVKLTEEYLLVSVCKCNFLGGIP